MNTERITKVATRVVDGFDTTAHTLIDAWRDGGERLGTVAKQHWDAAMKQSAAQLDAKTRKNAQHARAVFGTYYTRGMHMSASGATVAVDVVVQAARAAIERAGTGPHARA